MIKTLYNYAIISIGGYVMAKSKKKLLEIKGSKLQKNAYYYNL